MSILTRIGKRFSKEVKVFEEANFRTDSEMRTLTRDDLRDLFPEAKHFRMRRDFFEIIHEQRQFDDLIREVKAFIPDEQLRAALTSNGVLVDYLLILKDMKTQMNTVQSFCDAHIRFLEEFSKDTPGPDSSSSNASGPDSCPPNASGPGSSSSTASGPGLCPPYASGPGSCPPYASGPVSMRNNQTNDCPPEAQGFFSHQSKKLIKAKVVIRMIISGTTFDAHLKLMDKVKNQGRGVCFVEDEEDHVINVVFCPITSRIGSDVDTAMTQVTDTKPVILVLMHHMREPKPTPSMATWTDTRNVVLLVNVFFHDSVHGLVQCRQNEDAADNVRETLREYSTPQHTSEAAVATESSYSIKKFFNFRK